MSNSLTVKSKYSAYSTLRCGYTCVFLLLLPCFAWGAYAAFTFIKYHNIETTYRSTICQLLNYTVLQHDCLRCASFHCTTDQCFDEQMFVTYPIHNKTSISSVFITFNQLKMHDQSQIGNSYTCFYQTTNLTSIMFDLPDKTIPLTILWITVGLIIIPFSIFAIALLYILGKMITNFCINVFRNSNINFNYEQANVHDIENCSTNS
ncbi:hypothetical protein I4U23_003805 [Adineta vaga]|nr:hypothetical protein I4U23_003805 [Adineta vaga]